jgi:anti-sigma-K factor RskA
MDQLSTAEKAEVEGYIRTFPELKIDIAEIERSLELFAASAAVQAPAGLKIRILDQIKNEGATEKSKPVSSSGLFGMWRLAAALFGLGFLLFGYLFWQKSDSAEQLQQELTALRDSCEQSSQQLTDQLRLLQQLTYPDNTILPFTATPGFASTDLYLHHNAETKRNFIQVRNLPAIAANQSYQLWSLKANQAPTPLDVFDLPSTGLIEVRYVDGTETYAITIEPKGGKDSPTLENLIGTVSVAGI